MGVPLKKKLYILIFLTLTLEKVALLEILAAPLEAAGRIALPFDPNHSANNRNPSRNRHLRAYGDLGR